MTTNDLVFAICFMVIYVAMLGLGVWSLYKYWYSTELKAAEIPKSVPQPQPKPKKKWRVETIGGRIFKKKGGGIRCHIKSK